MNNGNITTGALLGLIATWVSIIFVYINLRRSLKSDNQKSIEDTVTRIVKKEIETIAPKYIEDAEKIEKYKEQRYNDWFKRIERLEEFLFKKNNNEKT